MLAVHAITLDGLNVYDTVIRSLDVVKDLGVVWDREKLPDGHDQ